MYRKKCNTVLSQNLILHFWSVKSGVVTIGLVNSGVVKPGDVKRFFFNLIRFQISHLANLFPRIKAKENFFFPAEQVYNGNILKGVKPRNE
jgi:hypothetical protein